MIFYLFFFNFFIIGEQPEFELKINIHNIKYSGKMYFALYDNPVDFNSDNQSVEYMKIAIREIVIPDKHVLKLKVEKGRYAVKIYIDKNLNQRFDTNIIGLPKEQFGFSNDAMGVIGPPTYEKASFVVSENKLIKIKMK